MEVWACRPRVLTRRAEAGFTLAEVMAALLFMAIVIPVAVKGLQVASRAGEVAQRKVVAARLAERLLNESLITTNWNRASQQGVIMEGPIQYSWAMRTETWTTEGNIAAPRLLSVMVEFPVQNQKYSVRLSTLARVPQS